MKKTFMAVVALVCAALVCSCGSKNERITEGDHDKLDTLSYCLGANTIGGLKQQFHGIEFNIDAFATGYVDGLTNKAKKNRIETVELLTKFFNETLSERGTAYQEALAQDSTAVFNAFKSVEECSEISYAIGSDIGRNMLDGTRLPIQYYWFAEGLKDGWKGEAKLSEEQTMAFLNHYFMQVLPAENAERSAKWLEAKKQATGVKATESGLLYKVIEEGDMSKAAKNDSDIVKVHYIGRLQDGTIFDASHFENWPEMRQEMMRKQQPSLFDENGKFKDDQPVEFPLNRVIKGWTEGMKLIGPGGKIVLYVPAELAYGRGGAGGLIGPNEALEFEVELIEVTPGIEVETPAEQPAEKVAEQPAEKPAEKVAEQPAEQPVEKK